jgi:hypothetical protein
MTTILNIIKAVRALMSTRTNAVKAAPPKAKLHGRRGYGDGDIPPPKD